MSDNPEPVCADTHCHLDDPAFTQDLAEVIRRAKEAAIHPLVVPAESLESSRRVLEIAAAHQTVLPCVGIHPHQAGGFSPDQKPDFESMAGRPEVVAIGEIGLDYFYEHSGRDEQIETLDYFLDLAARLRKPVCLHVRDQADREGAAADLLNLIRPRAGKIRGVVHCFTGSLESARSFLELGFHISFTGILTFKKADSVREVFAKLPLDRVLLETDSPYLAPAPRRGIRNEPMFLRKIFDLAAGLRGLDDRSFSGRLRQTQQDLFGDRCA